MCIYIYILYRYVYKPKCFAKTWWNCCFNQILYMFLVSTHSTLLLHHLNGIPKPNLWIPQAQSSEKCLLYPFQICNPCQVKLCFPLFVSVCTFVDSNKIGVWAARMCVRAMTISAPKELGRPNLSMGGKVGWSQKGDPFSGHDWR